MPSRDPIVPVLTASLLAPVLACSLPAKVGEDIADVVPLAGASGSSTGGTSDDGAPGSTGDDAPSSTGAQLSGSGTMGDMSTDSGSSDTGAMACVAPTEISCDDTDTDPLHALAIDCPGGTAGGGLVIEDAANVALAAATAYGDDWLPVEGERLVVLSTGRLVPGADPSAMVEASMGLEDNANPNGVPLPAPISIDAGSNAGAGGSPFVDCDDVGDCSDSLQWWGGVNVNDTVVARFEVDVPDDVAGFRLDFALMTAEYPEFVFSQFSDLFAVWVDGELFTGNACALGQFPCSSDTFVPMTEEGGPGTVGGGATGWRTLRVPALANDTVEVTIALLDGGDAVYDTAVVLDRWRWDCGDCRTDLAEPCGVNPQLAY